MNNIFKRVGNTIAMILCWAVAIQLFKASGAHSGLLDPFDLIGIGLLYVGAIFFAKLEAT